MKSWHHVKRQIQGMQYSKAIALKQDRIQHGAAKFGLSLEISA